MSAVLHRVKGLEIKLEALRTASEIIRLNSVQVPMSPEVKAEVGRKLRALNEIADDLEQLDSILVRGLA